MKKDHKMSHNKIKVLDRHFKNDGLILSVPSYMPLIDISLLIMITGLSGLGAVPVTLSCLYIC
jgi:hypothetical protein